MRPTQMELTLPDTSFPHLSRYAAFLLDTCLSEAAAVNMKLAKQRNLPLLKIFSHLKEEELQEILVDSLETLFQKLVEQQALEHTKEILLKWRTDQLPYIPRNEVVTADLVLVYHVRKQVLLGFIGRFTTKVEEAIALAKEIDYFFAEAERYAVSLFVDLKEEEHQKIVAERDEKNNELAAALEELQVAEERLRKGKDELEKMVEERTQALSASEHQLRTITDALPGLITYIDSEERYQFLNKTYEEWFAISRAEVVGKTLEEVYGLRLGKMMGSAVYDQVKANIQRALRGERLQYETILRTKDGDEKHVLVNYVPDVTLGEVKGYFALATDITKRKEAELALQESEGYFRSFADNIQNLAWMTDAEGEVLWFNQRWYDYTGTTFEEMQQQGWLKVHHPDHINRVNGHVNQAREKGENWEITFPLRRADGAWGWFLARAIAVRNQEGQIIRWIGTSTEVTEQIKAQEQLRKVNEENMGLLQREQAALAAAQQQRERLFNLFMQAPSLLCINFGEDFVYELANPSYLEALMVDDSILGKPLKEAFPNADPTVVAIYKKVYATGERYIGNELPATDDWRRDNQPYTRYFNIIYEPIHELDGTISGIITFGYEVTEQVKARQELEQNALLMQTLNQELSQKNAELSKINNDLDNFVYTASHDLRSPIVNLEGLLMAFNKQTTQQESPQQAALVKMMNTSVQKLKKTIADLAEITKVQKGLEEAKEEVVFAELMEEVKEDLPAEFHAFLSAIQEDFQVPSVRYSRGSLRSILYNLLSNAIKYRSEQRPLEIRIRTALENGQLVLEVADNGLGMNEKQLPKLFTMFKRLHTHVEGTGIGLYIIKRIIENNGGKIEVSSQPNQGSAFRVCLTY